MGRKPKSVASSDVATIEQAKGQPSAAQPTAQHNPTISTIMASMTTAERMEFAIRMAGGPMGAATIPPPAAQPTAQQDNSALTAPPSVTALNAGEGSEMQSFTPDVLMGQSVQRVNARKGIETGKRRFDASKTEKHVPRVDASGKPVYTVKDGQNMQASDKRTTLLDSDTRKHIRRLQRSELTSVNLAILTKEQLAILQKAGKPADACSLSAHETRDTGTLGYGQQAPCRFTMTIGEDAYTLKTGAGVWLQFCEANYVPTAEDNAD